jgi:hypothetical protein
MKIELQIVALKPEIILLILKWKLIIDILSVTRGVQVLSSLRNSFVPRGRGPAT